MPSLDTICKILVCLGVLLIVLYSLVGLLQTELARQRKSLLRVLRVVRRERDRLDYTITQLNVLTEVHNARMRQQMAASGRAKAWPQPPDGVQ